MKHKIPAFRLLSIAIAVQTALYSSAWSVDFTVANATTDTTSKTITTGDTGTVQAGGTQSTNGSSQAIPLTYRHGMSSQPRSDRTITTCCHLTVTPLT